jgi:hypothetical protein
MTGSSAGTWRGRNSSAGVVLLAGIAVAGSLALESTRHVLADQALETETARILPPGRWEAGAVAEFQTSKDGVEVAIPAFAEVGLGHRLEFLIEPVFYAGIFPKDGGDAQDVGDVELTLTGLVLDESCSWPAIALAAEVKLPTATDPLIGSGKADFTGYFIASRRFGNVDVHFNFGYTIVGKPAGADVQNVFNFALAAEWKVCPRVDLVAEVLYTSSALRSGGSVESATTPEASGDELVGTVGARYHITECWDAVFGVSYDNQNALGLRVGFTWKF